MFSIYHFWNHLVHHKSLFLSRKTLDEFPFDEKMLACRNKGIFPDLAIRINRDKTLFTGGELIELKDSNSYSVSSFNSTLPTGQKNVETLITSENSTIRIQMEQAGNDILTLPVREVFYLIRGRKKEHTKVCLVHGSFFETVRIEELIKQSFSQVLDERLNASGMSISDDVKTTILSLFSEQASFSKVRNIPKASVKLRFRIMTEVKAEGNILNPKKYPAILDDTLNFIVPCHSDDEKALSMTKMRSIAGDDMARLRIFLIKHHFNGNFLVFQLPLVQEWKK